MEKTISVPQETVNKLQALSVEVESRKDLIAFMINSDMASSEQFLKYQEEYREFFKQYSEAKSTFEKEFVRTAIENPIKWNLDFNTAVVTITY